MIRGIHGLFYSSDPDATRAFFRDQVKLPGCDIGEGWWIFDFAEGDLGVHPVDDPAGAGAHALSFYCDDIHGTVADLRARGVQFSADVADHGYGFVTYFTAPGGIKIQLYEPKYEKGTTRPERAPRKATARGKAPRPASKTKKSGGAPARNARVSAAARTKRPAAKPKAGPRSPAKSAAARKPGKAR